MVIRLFFLLLMALTPVMAASAQDAKEIYKQAKALYDAQNYEQAVPLLRVAAERGHKKAQYRLGRCYDKGRGVEKDKAIAFQWYQKSARQNYCKAQYQVGKAYLKGKVVTADEREARLWLKRAVNNPKGGNDIRAKITNDAAEGDETARRMLQLIL